MFSAEAMKSRLLFLPRHLSSSSGVPSSVDVVAGEISALLAVRRQGYLSSPQFWASVNRVEQFIRSKAVISSVVPELYRAVAAAGPRGQTRYLHAAASALVEGSLRAALPDGALRLFDLLNDTAAAPLPSVKSCGLLVVELLSLGRHADARRVFKILDAACKHHHYNAISVVWSAGWGANAFKLFGEMADPNRSRYVSIQGHLKKGDLEAASELRTRMMQAGEKRSNNKKHQRMLRMLAQVGTCPNKDKVKICIMAQNIDGAICWLRHMGHDGNAHSYNLVITALWKAKRGDDAVKLFGEMADISLVPNHFTYTVMINGHLKRLSNDLTPKKDENGELEAALQLQAQMVQAGLKPDECTYRLLMAELCSAERLGDVTALFREMLMQGTTLHKIVHGKLLEFLFKVNEDQLLGIIEESAKNGVAAVDSGCITLLKELCRIQKVSLAEKVLQTFAKTGLVPTTEMYNVLINGYCKIGKLQGAFLLCRQIDSHDRVVPDEDTYKALLLAVRNNTSIIDWEDMVELFEKNGVSTDALIPGNSAI